MFGTSSHSDPPEDSSAERAASAAAPALSVADGEATADPPPLDAPLADSQVADSQVADPDYAAVRRHLFYSLSLPERALRSAAGLVGGALHHSAELLVPQAFQDSQTYTVLVQQTLDFMIEDVARIEREKKSSAAAPPVENFVARKTVGNFVEMAGLATMHLSPLTLLAVVSDVAYGSHAYLQELSAELKKQGVIDQQTVVDHAGDLLSAVGRASAVTSSAFNTPPISVDGLRQTIDETRAALAQIDPTTVIPKAEIDRMWSEMRELAGREGVGILDISSAMTLHSLAKIATVKDGALSSVRAAGTLVDRHVLEHYRTALGEIRQRGLYATLAESSRPYIAAVWRNFSTETPTLTADLLSGKLVGQAKSAVRRWLGYDAAAAPSDT